MKITNTCKHCQERIPAYIHRELPVHVRRRMARHIHNCPRCSFMYRRQRDLEQLLDADLPSFGAPARPQLAGIWAGVQSGIRQPRSYAHRSIQRLMPYSVVMMLFFIMLFLPLALADQPALLTVPAPALPELTATLEASANAIRTEGSAPSGTAIASNLETRDGIVQDYTAADTPAVSATPDVQPPLIPVPSVTASR